MILTIVFRRETTLDDNVSSPFPPLPRPASCLWMFHTRFYRVEETRPPPSVQRREGTRLISFHRHRPSRVLSTRDAAKKEPEVHVLRAPSSPLYIPLHTVPDTIFSIAYDRERSSKYIYIHQDQFFSREIRKFRCFEMEFDSIFEEPKR